MSKTKSTVIGRTGTFRDSEGRKRTFIKEDFEKIAHNYNTSKTDAPLVIGHVKNDSAPAYGWVETLFLDNDKLCATFSCVNEEVKKLVQTGAYRNVSMSIDLENHRLLHVALLGAAAPAIDGLGAINLNYGENISVFTMENNNKENRMNEETLKKKIEELEKEIQELKFSLQQTTIEKENAEKKAEETQAEFSAYLAKQENDTRMKRVEKLIANGQLEPSRKNEVYTVATSLAQSPSNFSAERELSTEELYFRHFEEQNTISLFSHFSNAPAHSQEQNNTWIDPQVITTKL